jgi:hypothetical protein
MGHLLASLSDIGSLIFKSYSHHFNLARFEVKNWWRVKDLNLRRQSKVLTASDLTPGEPIKATKPDEDQK